MRKDKESFLTPEEVAMSLYYSKHVFETRKNLSHVIGKEKYSMIEYAKVKMISIPLQDDNLLLISTETEGVHFRMIDHILKVIENYPPENNGTGGT